MSGFFSKIFGGKKKDSAIGGQDSAAKIVEEIMSDLAEKAQLELNFDVRSEMSGEIENVSIEVSGSDEHLVTEKEGALLDAFQLFVKRVLQHQLPNVQVNVNFDSNGFREESSKELVELAEKLKEKCIEQGRSVYLPFQHIGILSLEFHVDKLSRPLL